MRGEENSSFFEGDDASSEKVHPSLPYGEEESLAQVEEREDHTPIVEQSEVPPEDSAQREMYYYQFLMPCLTPQGLIWVISTVAVSKLN